jgi:hypothetical protein
VFPSSWRILLKACPGLGTPALLTTSLLRSPGFCLRPYRQPRLSQPGKISELTLAAHFLAAYASSLASHLARGKAHYRPARYGFDRAGLPPAGFLRKVSSAHLEFPFPKLSLARRFRFRPRQA